MGIKNPELHGHPVESESAYVSPSIKTYSHDEILEEIGPAHANGYSDATDSVGGTRDEDLPTDCVINP